MGLFNKKELQEIERLKNELSQLGGLEYIEIKNKTEEKQELITSLNNELENLEKEIINKKEEIKEINLNLEMSDFALYIPTYECVNSQEYLEKINENRNKQKELIKNKKALNFSTVWTLDGSKAKGNAMNNDNMKMYLRAFNNECENLISKVKFNNFNIVEERIKKVGNTLNKLNERNKISVTTEFLKLKLEELRLVHSYNCKKQDEKEAIKEARAEEREQQKLAKEIEESRKKINKELTHYENAKEKLVKQLEEATENDIIEIKNKINEIDEKICEINDRLKDIDYREANQRAGYVYVISNIGAFGNDIYKIGMTRRLEPLDRIDELGDASVPFKFDVHAMIFSDDAPKLEKALHTSFENRKLNLINSRKEFFNVSLKEIEKVVKENHDKLIEFKEIADAEQYRESEKLKEILN